MCVIKLKGTPVYDLNCDRCQVTTNIENPRGLPTGWIGLTEGTTPGAQASKTLCPNCAAAFAAFMTAA